MQSTTQFDLEQIRQSVDFTHIPNKEIAVGILERAYGDDWCKGQVPRVVAPRCHLVDGLGALRYAQSVCCLPAVDRRHGHFLCVLNLKGDIESNRSLA